MEQKPDESLCERLITVVNSISDGVLAIDPDRRITFMNRAAERITGFSLSEALGRHCWDIFHTNVCRENCPLSRVMNGNDSPVNRPICVTPVSYTHLRAHET